MRLAWCTPFAPRSAIGRFSALVVPSIRTQHGWDVDIWYPEGAGGRRLPDAGFELTRDSAVDLLEYDAVIFNIGDHAGYHGALVDLARDVPGTMIVHDLALTHLMLDKLVGHPRDVIAYELSRWYESASADETAYEMKSDPAGWVSRPQSVDAFPLTELAVSNALGIITHSQFAAARIRGLFAGDVWTLRLPALHFDNREIGEAELPMLDERPIILQAGVLNANKCVSTVVEAFEQASIADRAQLVICGYAEPQDLANLHRDIGRRNLTDSVRVLGAVSDATLHTLRRRAQFATVLRHPCIEAASAVLLDSMAYGLAVLSVDDGSYAEVPEASIVRVSAPPRTADVAGVLRSWVEHPDDARALGIQARAYAEAKHTPARYADGVVEVIRESGAMSRRRALAVQVSGAVTRAGFGADDEITDRLAEVTSELFAGRPRFGEHFLAGSDTAAIGE
jgi:glycosyltransferase involved in cell wall biosynthesis